jgi:glycolate oxidase FAD binding subunit
VQINATSTTGIPSAGLSIDGQTAMRVATPSTEPECVELIAETGRAGAGLVPVGGGVSLSQGNRLACAEWVAAATTELSGILDYSPDDMVLTARAGTTLAAVQAELAKHRQFIPLDCPFPDRAALGGIVATNAHGLWRPAYGVPRDRLLGVRVAMADGSVVRGGGKVVKNVAGYDLCKLFAGSWGTLGLITEVTFKTNPAPPRREHLWFEGGSVEQAIRAGLAVHSARLEPVYLVACVSDGIAALAVGLHGGEESVGWQADAIEQKLTTDGLRREEPRLTEDRLRHAIGEARGINVRITVRPTDLPGLASEVAPIACSMVCHIQTGILEATIGDVGMEFTTLRRKLDSAAGAGHLVWMKVPADRKPGLDVWGTSTASHALMRKLKHALDPQRLFNPGRFLGGI